MAEPVTIPISTFEISISYARPLLSLWVDRAAVIQGLFDVFEPWKLSLDDLEPVTTGKPSEQGVKFKIPAQRLSFFVGIGSCKLTKEAANWSETEEVMRILGLSLEILAKAGVEFGKKATSLALHLQPQNLSFKDVLRPLLVSRLSNLEASLAEALAFVIRWKGRRLTLDGSAALANGLFVHMERDFDAGVSFEDILHTMHEDERVVFKLLGVEEVES